MSNCESVSLGISSVLKKEGEEEEEERKKEGRKKEKWRKVVGARDGKINSKEKGVRRNG